MEPSDSTQPQYPVGSALNYTLGMGFAQWPVSSGACSPIPESPVYSLHSSIRTMEEFVEASEDLMIVFIPRWSLTLLALSYHS